MINQSVVILGRLPALGLAELESLYGVTAVRPVGNEAALVDKPAAAMRFDRLGGAIRLCEVIGEASASDWPAVQTFIERVLAPKIAALPEGKVQIGISVYGLRTRPAQILAAGLNLKKILKKAGRSVRLTPNTEAALSSAQVLHNHLTGATGYEIILVRDGNRTICARTTHVQDIDAYTLRDRGRPKRDARVGMLPPKLAQIIINLAGNYVQTQDITTGQAVAQSRLSRLLDPFCGTGVVLQEALLMGFDVYGTDLEPRMIEYSQANLAWLAEHYTFAGTHDAEAGDATTFQWKQPIDLVACEAYLGQPFSTFPAPQKLEQVRTTCNTILEKFLANIGPQLKPGTRLCLAVPAWQQKPGQFVHVPTLDHLGKLGYNRVDFKHVRTEQLIYSRDDQIVARELLVITRK